MSDEKLVPVSKDGVTLEVHPTALKEHLALGWMAVEKVVEEVEELVKPKGRQSAKAETPAKTETPAPADTPAKTE